MKESLIKEKELDSKEDIRNNIPEEKKSEEALINNNELDNEQDKKEVFSMDKNTIEKVEIEGYSEKEETNQDKEENNHSREDKIEDETIKKLKQNQTSDNKAKEEQEKVRNQEKAHSDTKKGKKVKKIIISVVIVFIIALLFSTVFALTNVNNGKIINGVTIKGIDVSGLTKEEANTKLEMTYAEKLKANITLQYEEFTSELNPTLMEVSYDIEGAVNEAYSLGRNGNLFTNNYNILGTLIGKRDINVNMSMNEETAKQTNIDMGTNLPGIMTESSYSIEEDKLIITRGKEGIVLDTDALLSLIKEELNDIQKHDNIVEIPVKTKTTQEIDIEKIHSEIYKEAKDAYYTKDPFTVYPDIEGVNFDVEKAKEIIKAEIKDEYIIDLIITKPNVTIDQIGTEAFPDRLSTFTTRYNAGDKDRTTNLVLACQKLNGTVLKPGETFSYNKTLGPRTVAAGYKNAKIYSSGQVVDGLGGGICQISSTLYNAALLSDMKIVERRNHQFVTSYVGEGRDATVVYGATDFRFKNTRKYPVRIVASAKGGIATVSIFGIKEADREYTYSFSTEVVSTIPYTTKYVQDSSLAPGKEVVKQKGANGVVTKTYMTKKLNGKVVSTELLSKDTYSAMQKIINRGVAKTTSSKTPSNSASTTNNTPTTDNKTEEPVTPSKETDETQKTEEQTQTQTTE